MCVIVLIRTLEDPPPSHVRKPPLNHRSAVAPTPSHRPVRQSFAALRNSGYRAQFVTYFLAMMADNIEHVISYWVMFQKFHSPALAGFAVLSHWLPFLLFSVASGALADRFDPRRLIQCGMGLFVLASLGWGYFFLTDTSGAAWCRC